MWVAIAVTGRWHLDEWGVEFGEIIKQLTCTLQPITNDVSAVLPLFLLCPELLELDFERLMDLPFISQQSPPSHYLVVRLASPCIYQPH